ncbi:hypothetical protein AB1N83_010660 [Pleurotus pulmonarius]
MFSQSIQSRGLFLDYAHHAHVVSTLSLRLDTIHQALKVMLALPIQQEPPPYALGYQPELHEGALLRALYVSMRRNAVKITPQDHRGCRISRLKMASLVSGAVVVYVAADIDDTPRPLRNRKWPDARPGTFDRSAFEPTSHRAIDDFHCHSLAFR